MLYNLFQGCIPCLGSGTPNVQPTFATTILAVGGKTSLTRLSFHPRGPSIDGGL